MNKVTKNDLQVGMTIYNEQARWFDYDYHPQKITEIDDNEIEVFEEGINKSFTVKISSLRREFGEIIY